MRHGPTLGFVMPALLATLPASAQDLPELKARGALRLLAVPVPDFPQFLSVQKEKPSGFDYEVLSGFCRLQRLELQVVAVESWGGLVPALREGKGDLIAGGFRVTPSRRDLIDFSVEAFPSRRVVMSRAPHRVVRTIDELRSERVGTIRGSALAELVASLGVPPRNVDDGVPPGGLVAALRSGRVTAAIDGVEVALVAAQEDAGIQLGMWAGPPESLAYGVRKDSPRLRQELDTYLGNFRRTLSWNRLVVKYFGPAAPEVLKKSRGTE